MSKREIESSSTSASTLASSPTSASDQDDEYYGLFGDEPQKGVGALALLISSMQWEAVGKATMLELRSITKANDMAKDALMSSKKRKESVITSEEKKASKKPKKANEEEEEEEEEEKYDMRKFPKLLLGLDIEDCELPILPPVEKLRGSVGLCSKPFMKVLTYSDVNDRHCRLSLVRSYAIETILPLLDKKERKQLDGDVKIDVSVFDQHGKEHAMMFQKWAKGKFYVLRGSNWKAFVADKALKGARDWVSVWSFRHLETGRLCFAVVPKRIPIDPSWL